MAKAKKLEGLRFGRLVVESRDGKNKRNEAMWICRCDCGRSHRAKSAALTGGTTKSCGCLPTGPSRGWSAKVGDRYGRIVVLSMDWDNRNRSMRYKYRCDCGNQRSTWGGRIRRIKSCGCHTVNIRRTGFGEISGTYWAAIQKSAAARGIEFNLTIEEAWLAYQKQDGKCALSGVELTLYTSRAQGQVQTASIDRRDSSLGYEPGNIQWVHKTVNKMKLDHSEEDFVFWCSRIASHNQKVPHEQDEQLNSSCRGCAD